MKFSLLPNVILDSVTEITPAFLEERGIRLLMLDFDNTLLPYTSNKPTTEVSAWLDTMLASSVSICVVSNSKKGRVPAFCEERGIPCVTHSKKPFPKGIRRCLSQFDLRPHDCALAGDQIYTDTLGANCAGVTSILVKPLHLHNIWLKLRHGAEKPFIFLARNRRIDL